MSEQLWLPRAIRKPLAIDRSRDPLIHPVGAVFHIAVSEAESLFGDFKSRTDGIESTGYIRRRGATEQYRPLTTECDAQADGNSWVRGGTRYGFTSWESQGMGAGQWTDFQVAEIQRIIEHLHHYWAAPLRTAPDWNQPGFGYHRLFDRWNPNGHSCPGDDRVAQWHDVIEPWMRARAHPAAPSRVARARELIVSANAAGPHDRAQQLDRVGELLAAARRIAEPGSHRQEKIAGALELLPQLHNAGPRRRAPLTAQLLALLPLQ